MSYRLRITDEAAELLLSSARWYAETSQSLDVAAAWHDGFLDQLDSLTSNPFRGPVAPENDAFDFELREIHYGSGKRLTHRALLSNRRRNDRSAFNPAPCAATFEAGRSLK